MRPSVIDGFRNEEAQAEVLAFLNRALPFTYLNAVVMQELAAGARTAQSARAVQQGVFEPFQRRRRVFAPSSVAFAESGRVLAAIAANEGGQMLNQNPSLLNDALIAVSCREQGITLVTKDGDFKRLSSFVRGFRYAAPWPTSGDSVRRTEWRTNEHARRVKVMKTVDRLAAVLILLLGTIHAGLAPVFRGRYDGAGMWFLSGGLMLIFLGLLNLVRIGSPGAAARWAALAANILALGFVCGLVPLVSLRQNPQVTFSILLLVAATLFSLLRRQTPTA